MSRAGSTGITSRSHSYVSATASHWLAHVHGFTPDEKADTKRGRGALLASLTVPVALQSFGFAIAPVGGVATLPGVAGAPPTLSADLGPTGRARLHTTLPGRGAVRFGLVTGPYTLPVSAELRPYAIGAIGLRPPVPTPGQVRYGRHLADLNPAGPIGSSALAAMGSYTHVALESVDSLEATHYIIDPADVNLGCSVSEYTYLGPTPLEPSVTAPSRILDAAIAEVLKTAAPHTQPALATIQSALAKELKSTTATPGSIAQLTNMYAACRLSCDVKQGGREAFPSAAGTNIVIVPRTASATFFTGTLCKAFHALIVLGGRTLTGPGSIGEASTKSLERRAATLDEGGFPIGEPRTLAEIDDERTVIDLERAQSTTISPNVNQLSKTWTKQCVEASDVNFLLVSNAEGAVTGFQFPLMPVVDAYDRIHDGRSCLLGLACIASITTHDGRVTWDLTILVTIRSLGRQLLRFVIAAAAERGIYAITLNAISLLVCEFYASMGFVAANAVDIHDVPVSNPPLPNGGRHKKPPVPGSSPLGTREASHIPMIMVVNSGVMSSGCVYPASLSVIAASTLVGCIGGLSPAELCVNAAGVYATAATTLEPTLRSGPAVNAFRTVAAGLTRAAELTSPWENIHGPSFAVPAAASPSLPMLHTTMNGFHVPPLLPPLPDPIAAPRAPRVPMQRTPIPAPMPPPAPAPKRLAVPTSTPIKFNMTFPGGTTASCDITTGMLLELLMSPGAHGVPSPALVTPAPVVSHHPARGTMRASLHREPTSPAHKRPKTKAPNGGATVTTSPAATRRKPAADSDEDYSM